MKPTPSRLKKFQKTVIRFYKRKGRSFPWRKTHDPYAILVSEVMLQQTQTDRVVPKYLEWMRVFPTVKALANAKVGDVLKKWQGLGYNRRALSLKRSAEMIMKEYGGVFPKTISEIDALPGVGPYTAGAIGVFAFGIPSAFIETNIRTVYLHFFFEGKRKVRDEEILKLVERTLPTKRNTTTPPRRPTLLTEAVHLSLSPKTERSRSCDVPSIHVSPPQLRRGNTREWYNALMDYGAMLKKTEGNLNTRSVHYAKQSMFKGSKREVRGAILRLVSEKGIVKVNDFKQYASAHPVTNIISELTEEGFLKKEGKEFRLA